MHFGLFAVFFILLFVRSHFDEECIYIVAAFHLIFATESSIQSEYTP